MLSRVAVGGKQQEKSERELGSVALDQTASPRLVVAQTNFPKTLNPAEEQPRPRAGRTDFYPGSPVEMADDQPPLLYV